MSASSSAVIGASSVSSSSSSSYVKRTPPLSQTQITKMFGATNVHYRLACLDAVAYYRVCNADSLQCAAVRTEDDIFKNLVKFGFIRVWQGNYTLTFKGAFVLSSAAHHIPAWTGKLEARQGAFDVSTRRNISNLCAEMARIGGWVHLSVAYKWAGKDLLLKAARGGYVKRLKTGGVALTRKGWRYDHLG